MNWDTLTVDAIEAVAATLTVGLPDARVQALEDLSDGLADLPLIQVHWTDDDIDPYGNTDQTTFRGGVKQVTMTMQLWGFIRARSVYADDTVAVAEWVDKLRVVLFAQDVTKFGTAGSPRIRSFAIRTEATSWDTADQRTIMGFRSLLTLRIF